MVQWWVLVALHPFFLYQGRLSCLTLNRVEPGRRKTVPRLICLGVLLLAGIALVSVPASASGSVAPGAGKINTRAAYALGKSITFRELVCRNCPISRRELNRSRARSLKDSIESAFDENKVSTSDDEHIKVLCDGKAEDCTTRLELVNYYLTRRYRL